jgi:hypothetical protein
MVLRSTSAERTSAATKFWSFSRKAQSLATQRSSLSRHQPVYWRSPSGAAVLAFWTLTSLPVEFLERGELPGDALDEVGEALGLGVVVGDGGGCRSRQTWSRQWGSWSSRKVPRMDWEPTTITSGLPMIWHAVRIACSS